MLEAAFFQGSRSKPRQDQGKVGFPDNTKSLKRKQERPNGVIYRRLLQTVCSAVLTAGNQLWDIMCVSIARPYVPSNTR
jgi:hypothetical protein